METLRAFLSNEVDWVDQWMPSADHITIEWPDGPLPPTVARYLLPKYDPIRQCSAKGLLASGWSHSGLTMSS